MTKIKYSNLTYFLLVLLTAFYACDNDSDNATSDLSLTLMVDNSDPTFGDDVNINLSMENAGPGDATDVEVSIPLPSGLTYISSEAEPSTSYSENTGVWTIPSISNGEVMVLTLVARVKDDGVYELMAEVISADNEDPDSGPGNGDDNEDDQANLTLSPVLPSEVNVTTYAVVLGADGLTMDSEGNLYAANYALSTVYKIDKQKTVSTFLENQPGAAGMDLDDNGNLYLATYSTNQISKISLDDNTSEVYAGSVAAPIGLAFDSDGNLWTNNNVNSAVTKIDSEGNKTVITIDIYNNSSLTVDNNDHIYVSDYGSGRIIKIDSQTGDQSQFTSLPLNSGGVGFVLYADGYFYATAIADGVIFMIDVEGNAEIIAGKQGASGDKDGDGNQARFDRPLGIVASEDGQTLYVAQQGGAGVIRVITGFR